MRDCGLRRNQSHMLQFEDLSTPGTSMRQRGRQVLPLDLLAASALEFGSAGAAAPDALFAAASARLVGQGWSAACPPSSAVRAATPVEKIKAATAIINEAAGRNIVDSGTRKGEAGRASGAS